MYYIVALNITQMNMDTYYIAEQIIHITISEDEINVFLKLYFFVKYSKPPND